MSYLYFLLIFAGGIFYRQRGGGYMLPISFGTQGARVCFWALPTGLLAWFLCGNILIGLAVSVMTFAGLLFGHGAHQRSTKPLLTDESPDWDQTELLTEWLPLVFGSYEDLSYKEKETYHWIGASFINFVRLLILLFPLSIWYGQPLVLLAILGFIPAYYIGWRIPIMYEKAYVKEFLDDGGEWGEFCTGCVMWLSVVVACFIAS